MLTEDPGEWSSLPFSMLRICVANHYLVFWTCLMLADCHSKVRCDHSFFSKKKNSQCSEMKIFKNRFTHMQIHRYSVENALAECSMCRQCLDWDVAWSCSMPAHSYFSILSAWFGFIWFLLTKIELLSSNH